MVRTPKLCPATASVAEVRDLFRDEHVHAALLVEGSRLVAVLERGDLAGLADDRPARTVGGLAGRVIEPDCDLREVHASMAGRRRRLAVIDDAGSLLGLLCLKRSGAGFCSDGDVRSRAADRS